MFGIIILYLVSVHLGVGMQASLLPISQKALGEKFFRFNGTISIILLTLAQLLYRFYGSGRDARLSGEKVIDWTSQIDSASPWIWASAALTLIYVLTLPLQRYLVSRGILVAAFLSGGCFMVLMASSLRNRAIPPSVETFVFSMDFFLSALALGSVTICMILGHWYLVAPGMSVRHLKVVAGLFFAVVIARVLLGSYTSVLIWRELEASGADVLSHGLLMDLVFFAQRVLFGLVLPLALSWMIWQTVKIRSTQSATGILYVALVFMLFGEFLSHYILVSRGYPL